MLPAASRSMLPVPVVTDMTAFCVTSLPEFRLMLPALLVTSAFSVISFVPPERSKILPEARISPLPNTVVMLPLVV